MKKITNIPDTKLMLRLKEMASVSQEQFKSFKETHPKIYTNRSIFKYQSLEELVLMEGMFFESQKLNTEELEIVNEALSLSKLQYAQYDGDHGSCFSNSHSICQSDKSGIIQYYEGYGTGDYGMLIHHGWNAINGKVIDASHLNIDNKPIMGEFNNREYYGCRFSKESRAKLVTSGNNESSFFGTSNFMNVLTDGAD